MGFAKEGYPGQFGALLDNPEPKMPAPEPLNASLTAVTSSVDAGAGAAGHHPRRVVAEHLAAEATPVRPGAREDQPVMDFLNFLREHSTILLALFTVVTAFGGTWLGSHLQAKGGLAQAKAAKEAAETAANATLQAVREQSDRTAAAAHAAVVRDRRTAAIADLLRTTRELVRAVDSLYTHPGDGSISLLFEAFVQARGAVELCAPTSLLPATKQLAKTTRDLSDLSYERAEAHRAGTRLRSLEREVTDFMPIYRAVAALEAFRTAALAEDSTAMELHDQAEEALRQLPQLTSQEQIDLLVDCYYEELRSVLNRYRQDYYDAMSEFINQSRTVLGVND